MEDVVSKVGGNAVKKWSLVLACMFLILCSCNSNTEDVTSQNGVKGELPSSAVNAATEQEPEVLTLTSVSTGKMIEILQNAVEAFNRENSDQVNIQIQNFGTESYKEELGLKMAINEAPDLFFTWEAGFLKSFVTSGKVYEVGKALDADPIWEKSFVDGVFQEVSFDGSIYALPLVEALVVVYYNKEVFRQNGVTVPETYDAFLDACARFQEAGIYPMAVSGSLDWSCGQLFLQLLNGIGGTELYQGLIDSTVPWSDSRVQLAANELQRFYQEGYLAPDVLEISIWEAMQMMMKGEAAMYFDGSWGAEVGQLSQQEYGAFLLPPYREENRNVGIGSVDQCYAISAGCKNIEAACAFLKSLYTREVQSQLQQNGYISVCRQNGMDTDSGLLMEELVRLNDQLVEKTSWFDRKLGVEEGQKVNETAQKILCGYDPEELLEKLNQDFLLSE